MVSSRGSSLEGVEEVEEENGGFSFPSGQYMPMIRVLGLWRRGWERALCIACREEARVSDWWRVGLGSKSFSPRRGIEGCWARVEEERLRKC